MSAINYREAAGPIDEATLLSLGALAGQVFVVPGQAVPPVGDFAEQLKVAVNGHQWVHLGLASMGGALVGFKVGRSNDPRMFESWVGGVHPDARRQGIASQLAAMQEAWCRARGFQFIQTETAHDNQAMLMANLKRGFWIAGTYLNRGVHMKVILQKGLQERST